MVLRFIKILFLLTASDFPNRALFGRYPQVARTSVKYNIESLGWGTQIDRPIILCIQIIIQIFMGIIKSDFFVAPSTRNGFHRRPDVAYATTVFVHSLERDPTVIKND